MTKKYNKLQCDLSSQMRQFMYPKTKRGGSKMKMNVREFKVFFAAMVILIVMLVPAIGGQTAEWKPTKPIQFIVPYAPGGGSDVLARTIANVIDGEKLCPVPLIVVNQGGGSGTIGMTTVAQSPGNVHMLMTFISGQVTSPLIAGKGVATFHDLTLTCQLAIDEQLIVVKTDSPFKTVEDIVAAAKKRPGEVTIAGTATALGPTGMFSSAKVTSCCSTLSSYTLKSSLVRSLTRLPFLSRTVTSTTTRLD